MNEPNQNQNYWVRSFFTPFSKRSGNLHKIVFSPNRQPSTAADWIRVDVSLNAPHSAELRFSRAGYWIKRCGSGTLAAAHTLKNELGLALTSLSSSDDSLSVIHFKDQNNEELFGYQSQIPEISLLKPTKKYSDFFSCEVKKIFACGGDNDYLMFIFENELQIRELKPNFSAMAGRSGRAVIATALCNINEYDKEYDYAIRYFAPQYGTPEDSATGSANGLAGNYWLNETGKAAVHGIQISQQGGEFWARKFSEKCPASISVMGRVKTEGFESAL